MYVVLILNNSDWNTMENAFGVNGIISIAEALKVNTTLIEIGLEEIGIDVGVTYIINALNVNTTLTSIELTVERVDEVTTRDLKTIESLCQRNCQLQQPIIHARILDIVIAISSLDLPPYVILEIIDKFEYWSNVDRKFKIDTIIAVDQSCKRVRSLRK